MYCAGGLIATWTYIPKLNHPIARKSQIPGNSLNLAGALTQMILIMALWAWQRRENEQKSAGRDDHELEGKTADEIANLGQKHPGFRYRH